MAVAHGALEEPARELRAKLVDLPAGAGDDDAVHVAGRTVGHADGASAGGTAHFVASDVPRIRGDIVTPRGEH